MPCLSILTEKNTAEIPKEIRESLQLEAGDAIFFQVLDGNSVVIKKAKSLNNEYLESVQSTLSEWNSEQDEEAFEHLQD